LGEADWATPVYSAEAGQWTARDVLAHLADSERGQLGQVKRLVAGEQTVPPDFDLNRWNKRVVQKRAGQSPGELLGEIRAAYAALLGLLEGLDDADLDKVGRHARGDPLSAEGYFRRIAEHRAQHAAESRAALGEAVWRGTLVPGPGAALQARRWFTCGWRGRTSWPGASCSTASGRPLRATKACPLPAAYTSPGRRSSRACS
jgi:hypothetical protein